VGVAVRPPLMMNDDLMRRTNLVLGFWTIATERRFFEMERLTQAEDQLDGSVVEVFGARFYNGCALEGPFFSNVGVDDEFNIERLGTMSIAFEGKVCK
jgi:hypothetical protein